MIKWIKSNWVLVIILLIGTFSRFYKINSYMTFLGDEGRDAIIVRNLLVHADPILIGPGTSVGSMYLGPLYYYFMAPFLFLSNFSPVGPAIGVALLGILTIYLVYIIGREWFGQKAGLIAASLYAISPTVIIYSRSSWNPNIMPFFALLAIYSIWKVWKDRKYSWLFVTALSFAFVMQSHYLGLLLAPVLFLFWLISKVPPKFTLVSIFIFTLLMSPLAIFDMRHGFLNSKALYKFLTVRQETVSIRPWTAIPKSYPIFEQINSSMLTSKETSGTIVTLLLISWVIFYLSSKKVKKENKPQFYLLLIWIATGLIGFGVYKQHIYDHYFGFLFPAPFLLLGAFAQDRINTGRKYVIVTVYLLVAYLVFTNLKNSPLLQSPNNQMQRAKIVAEKIMRESNNDKFNIAVVAERNYEDGYQYFMEKEDAKVVEIDAQIPESITNQLFVICEMPKEKCNPTNSPKAEVANFGWSKIEMTWEVDGVIIYKLGHNRPEVNLNTSKTK